MPWTGKSPRSLVDNPIWHPPLILGGAFQDEAVVVGWLRKKESQDLLLRDMLMRPFNAQTVGLTVDSSGVCRRSNLNI